MKTNIMKAMVAIAVLLSGSVSVDAKSWRVNTNTNIKANFVDINAAMASEDVVAGDTIYLDPGCAISTEQTISKEVVVVGTGYFFTDQPHSMSLLINALNITAANVKVEGLHIKGETRIRANYVTLERCRMESHIWGNQAQCINATIRQCHINGRIYGYGSTDSRSANWLIENSYVYQGDYNYGTIQNLFNITVKNSFIRHTHTSTSSYYYSHVFYDCNNISLVNNVLMSGAKDRIFFGCTNYAGSGNVFSCSETAYVTLTESNVFLNSNDVNLVFSGGKPNDRWLELCEDSPAKGAGIDGVDAGPLGGLTPYVFSGYPMGRPYFKAASVSPVAKDGKVSVKLNVKMQDE